MLTRGNPLLMPQYSYALNDLATPTGSYVPLLANQTGYRGCGVYVSTPITIAPRPGVVGLYDVTFPRMGSFASQHAVTTVSAFGGYGENCKIASKSGLANGDANVAVQCYDTFGTPSPSQFSIVFGLDVATIC